MAKQARQKPKKSASAEPSYEAKFIAALVSDPVHPPQLHLFRGYLGKSAVTGHRRLYLSANLAKYIDLPESGIAHIEPVAATVDPLGAVLIWVQADAKIILPPTSVSSAAMYCIGEIQTQNLVPPPTPGYGFTDAGSPTCDGSPRCSHEFTQKYTDNPGVLTCGGKATCNGTNTCATQCYSWPLTCKPGCAFEDGPVHGGQPPYDGAYTDSAGALTCGGKATCSCGYTTPGMLTCDGKKTCSNCGYTDSQGMPTCDGKPTCNCAYGVEALGYTDSQGMPTCGGKATCKPNC